MPEADAQKWALRIKHQSPNGWTVKVKGNDIVVQRDKPVKFREPVFNADSAAIKGNLVDGTSIRCALGRK